ncbi:unnamed protein product [Colias eurytheme]|nr:unnamed protein product [Colias eurytheme]
MEPHFGLIGPNSGYRLTGLILQAYCKLVRKGDKMEAKLKENLPQEGTTHSGESLPESNSGCPSYSGGGETLLHNANVEVVSQASFKTTGLINISARPARKRKSRKARIALAKRIQGALGKVTRPLGNPTGLCGRTMTEMLKANNGCPKRQDNSVCATPPGNTEASADLNNISCVLNQSKQQNTVQSAVVSKSRPAGELTTTNKGTSEYEGPMELVERNPVVGVTEMQPCSCHTNLVSTSLSDEVTLDSMEKSVEPESCCPQTVDVMSGWSIIPQESRKANKTVGKQECDPLGNQASDSKDRKRQNRKRKRQLNTIHRGTLHSESEIITSDMTEKSSLQTDTSEPTTPKRLRIDDTLSTQETNDKPCPNESKTVQSTNYAEAVKDDLIVAITADAPMVHLTQEQSDHILNSLQPLLQQEAMNYREGDKRVLFRGKPTFSGGVLKMWCDDTHTLDWLKTAVKKVELPCGGKICVRKLAEVGKTVRCGILLPGVWEDIKAVGLQLHYHNDWAQVDRWLLLRADVQDADTFLIVNIPQDLVATIMEHKRCLGFFFGSVYIKFQGPKGKFIELPPNWDKREENVPTSADIDPNTVTESD